MRKHWIDNLRWVTVLLVLFYHVIYFYNNKGVLGGIGGGEPAPLLHQTDERKWLPYTPAPRWTSELKWELAHHSHTTIGHQHEANHRHFTSPVALNNVYIAAGIECYLRQSNIYQADNTETATPSYTLLNLSAGTDILFNHRKVAELYVTANNLLNRAFQSHLSRLKYADINMVTGRQGVYNMGRNVTFKLVIPIQF
jgi:iron complex outermembrane receptor protein